MSNGPGKKDNDRIVSKHLILVLALLAALLLTELMIFKFIGDTTGDGITRKDIFALTFGAFGTWIGAGAAYFFGRENMRTATESLLKMRERSPREMLAETKLSDMDRKPLPRKFKEGDAVKEVLQWLRTEHKKFFVVVVGEDDKFKCVVDEEAFYLFVHGKIKAKIDKGGKETLKTWYDEVGGASVKDVIEYCKKEKDLEGLVDAAVKLDEKKTALAALNLMEQENKYVTIIVDDEEHPIGYISTADIRRQVLKSE